MPLPSRCALSLVTLATLAGYGCDETLTVDPQALVETGTRRVTLDLGLGPFIDAMTTDAAPDLADGDGGDPAEAGTMDFGEADFGEADFAEGDSGEADFAEGDSGDEDASFDEADIDAPDADGQDEGE